MKVSTLMIVLSILCNWNYSQDKDALNFLKKYNECIDPLNRLDTIKFSTRESELIARTNLSPSGMYESIRHEHYCTDNGIFESLVNTKTGKNMTDALPLDPVYKNEFLIKYHLLLLRIDTLSNRFTIIDQTDSITVIREEKNEETYHLLTFDSKSYSILQTKRVTVEQNDVDTSETDYIEFKIIDDIKVPTKVRYSGKYAEAILTYFNYSFEPFDKSIFKE